jgi:hypothetical protein
LSIEKPLSASAFEQGMLKRPAVSLYSFENLTEGLHFPNSHQNDPAQAFLVPPAALSVCREGRSAGERV